MPTSTILKRRTLLAGGVGLVAVMIGRRSAMASEKEPAMQDPHGQGPVVEITRFRLVAGAEETALIAASAAVDGFLRTRPGFLARRLSAGEDHTYVDHVEWASLATATAAAEIAMTLPALAPFMALIDPASLSMEHNRLVSAVN
ncbi:MAG: antibiotic biosynthesis monooxygenase family protein [Labrys sp. (in: a-proteobacteria)]|jgi:hypothetical protein